MAQAPSRVPLGHSNRFCLLKKCYDISMASQSFESKSPFRDKDGKITDKRIEYEIATAENAARDRISHDIQTLRESPETPEQVAEREGLRFYRNNGVEIQMSEVPEKVLRALGNIYEVRMHWKLNEKRNVEFRRVDEPDGAVGYLMLFDFKKVGDASLCFRVHATSEGVTDEVHVSTLSN